MLELYFMFMVESNSNRSVGKYNYFFHQVLKVAIALLETIYIPKYFLID
ncbi:MAG: hypothetical protein AB4080_15390 [Trichodesmium sp.]